MSARRPSPWVRRLLRAPALLYEWNLGWLLGGRFLVLTHVGRRSGRRYQTVLEIIGAGPMSGEVLVVAGLGTTADRYRNVQAHPAIEVAVSRRRFRPVYRTLDEREAEAALADYERRNRWLAPVVHGMLSWLVGWHYDGTASARRRLVRELPLVAFWPAGNPQDPPAPDDSAA